MQRKLGGVLVYTWSKMRTKLENEYLADSLKGRIRYFVTTYRDSHDREGRAAILLDGKEIISGSYFEQWSKAHLLPKDETLEERLRSEFPFMDDTALKYGQFDQRCFYSAFQEFDNQSIEDSLKSSNLLIRIFAILDRRVGKKTLNRIKETIDSEPNIFNIFFTIRMKAEGLI